MSQIQIYVDELCDSQPPTLDALLQYVCKAMLNLNIRTNITDS